VFYWVLKTLILGPILRLLFRPWVEGEENIPTEGAAIFASNHLSFSDSIFLPLVVSRRVTFLAKSDYFTGRGVKGRATAAFFRGAGQLSVDRSGGRAGQAAVNSGLKVLRRGDLLGIYPEGTRSPDGRLYRGRTGVARMALQAGCPVLPVAMIGTDKAQPSGKRVPKIMRIGVRIGKPLDFSRYEGMEDDRFVLRSVTDEIMYELMLLSRQEYVDMYATSMKDRLLAAAKAKAKELQHEAADTIEKIDKGIKGDGASPAHEAPKQESGPVTHTEATNSEPSDAVARDSVTSDSVTSDSATPETVARDIVTPERVAPDDGSQEGADRPPKPQGDERAAS
jgi:1-acyl-sn-glycerol-3-phosphate acyltransferase